MMRQRRSIRDFLTVGRIMNIIILALVLGLFVFSTSLPEYTDNTTTVASVGSPITDTTAKQIFETIPYTTTTEALVFNITPYTLNQYIFYVPIYDYDTLWIEAKVSVSAADVNLTLEARVRTAVNSTRAEVTAGEIQTFRVKAPLQGARSQSTGWIQTGRVRFIPIQYNGEITVHSMIGIAMSQEGLCPLTLDIQSSDGDSLFENEYMNDLEIQPIIRIGKTESNLTTSGFELHQSMETIFVNPGEYNGTVYWETHPSITFDELIVSTTVVSGEHRIWAFQLPVIEVTFTATPIMPVYDIDIGNLTDLYELNGITGDVPELLYLPPLNTSIYIEAGVPDIWRGETSFAGAIPNNQTLIYVDGSHNIECTVTTEYPSISGIGFTSSELIIIVITTILLLIAMLRLMLFLMPEFMTRSLRDIRFLVAIVIIITAFLPWFESRQLVQGSPQNEPFLTYTFWSALSIVTVSSGNSLSLPVIQNFYFYIGLGAFMFFWVPLAYIITHMGVPRSWSEEGLFNAVMFPQAFLAGFSFWYTQFNNPNTTPFLGTYLAIGTPIVWLIMRYAWKLLRGKVPDNHDTLKSIEHAREIVPSFISELGHPENVEERALKILEEIRTDTVYHDSYDPGGFAAAAIFMACLELECEGINENRIVLASGIDSMRLRPIFRIISAELSGEREE